MPRNMSFMLTTTQYRARTKDVTRRLGWLRLKAGDPFDAVEKGMGLKKGERVVRLGSNVCRSERWEPLRRMLDDLAYGQAEVIREGFPEMTPAAFVAMFCRTHRGCTPDTEVHRIEFGYLDAPGGAPAAEARP